MRILDGFTHSPSPTLSPQQMEKLFLNEYRSLTGNRKVLYVHTPYCKSKCRFCICPSIACASLDDVTRFAREVLPAQLRQYEDLLNEVAFDEVYFGGGTPTLLPAAELERIFEQIPRFRAIPIKSLEGSPDTIAYEHLDLLRDFGFSFLSLGVQSLDQALLRHHRRTYIPPQELVFLADAIRATGLYLNMDLICYLGAGDITDIPDFTRDLEFVMGSCAPSSIVVHQHLQARFTKEKTELLMRVIRRALENHPDYECINALLRDEDVERDTMYRAEYRLVRERREFRHHLCTKYPSVPVPGSDVLALGWLGRRVSIKANAGTLLYEPAKQSLRRVEFAPALVEEERAIRAAKGLPA